MASKAQIIDFLLAGYRTKATDLPLNAGTIDVTVAGTANVAYVWDDRDKTLPTTTGRSTITLDAYGNAEVYGDGLYKFVIKDSAGSTVETIDYAEYLAGVDGVTVAIDQAAVKAIAVADISAGDQATMSYRTTIGDGGGGDFVFDTSDLSAAVTIDTVSGIYIAPSDASTGSSGAWVRQNNQPAKNEWFGTGIAAIQVMTNTVEYQGGGRAIVGPGTHTGTAYTLKEGVRTSGAGHGVTILKQDAGTNADFIVSDNYGVSDIQDFALLDLTVDGNYFTSDWNAVTGTTGNTSGYGLKIQGFNFDIDIELNNVAEVGAIFDSSESRPSGQSPYSRINIFGQIFGKEGVILKGPNDISINRAFIGLAGILPRPTAETTLATSTVYSGEPVDGIVVDATNVEFGEIHVFACWSGTGFRTRNTCRLEGDHLISESNTSQYVDTVNTYGSISILSIRNLGLIHPNWTAAIPSYTQPDALYDGVTINSDIEFSVGSLNCFRTITAITRIQGVTAVSVPGDANGIGMMTYYNSSPTDAGDADFGGLYTGDALYVSGKSNNIGVAFKKVKGNGVVIEDGNANKISGTVIEQTESVALNGDAVLKRISTGSALGRTNCIDLVCEGPDNVFNSSGTPSAEEIRLNYSVTSVDTLLIGDDRGSSAQQWLFTGTEITTPKSTVRTGGNEDPYTIAAGVITITSFAKEVRLDTEGAAASDDLDTINGGIEGQTIVVRTTGDPRNVVFKDGTGNMNIGADFTTTSISSRIVLQSDGTTWEALSREAN